MSAQRPVDEHRYILQCTQAIEQVLGWGPAKEWSNFDFEKLSDAIQEKTAIHLSVTTLKRVFGKIKYPHAPSTTTLNTLASFLGYTDWREYKSDLLIEGPESDEVTRTAVKKELFPKTSRIWFLIVASVIGFGLLLNLSFRKGQEYDPEDFQFTADKVISEGVPNTVIFTYDASHSQTDSIFIVQTWDIRRKTLVPVHRTKHSAIYYYPGFFRTKLIVDDQIVKSHDLQITSNGWLGLIEYDMKPIYFSADEIEDSLGVKVDPQLLAKYHLPLSPDVPKLRFFNQRDLGDLMNDNFVFETRLKNEYKSGVNVCQYVEVLIQCKDDIIISPLCSQACVGDLYLYAAGSELRSKDSDLSGFGADLSQWTDLKVLTVEKEMQFYVNGQQAASFIFPHRATGIVGVQYRFNGPGAIQYARFKNNGDWVNL